jgi:uncharacterized protein YhbP (UPF0306 family)
MNHAASIQSILKQNLLCSLASINSDSSPHINTAYFSILNNWSLIILTQPTTIHGKNLRSNDRVALSIFDSTQPWGEPHCGLQLDGTCKLVSDEGSAAAFSSYSRRFPQFLKLCSTVTEMLSTLESRFYVVKIERVKLIDEVAYGEETHFEVDLS